MFRKIICIGIILATAVISAAQQGTDTVIVIPFENATKRAEFNWVGESIADSLTDLLKVPKLGVVSNQQRKLLQQRLKIPAAVLPSLATSLKMAREAKASLLVAGNYTITPETKEVAASVTVKAKIIRVNEGRFLSDKLDNGTRVNRELVLTDALGNLQTVQGQLAFQILNQRDKALPFTLNEFVERANKVPAKAFEAYIKGLLTPMSDAESRANFFRNAIRIYDEQKSGEIYEDAALELGHLYLTAGRYANAIAFFSRIPQASENYPEAAFYSGLVHWRERRFEQALAVLRPLAEDLKLTSVYNILGAIAIEASRGQKKNKGKSAAFLVEGLEFLSKASESAVDDTKIFFNHGFALFLQQEYEQAAEKIRPVLANNPQDGEAYFLLAKILEKLGDKSSKDFDNQARRFLTENNKYANLESKWKTGDYDGIALRIKQPSRREFVSVVLTENNDLETNEAPVDETAALLNEAKAHYEAGRDDVAMTTLRRILVSEPMSAETYLLLGKIHLRRGDQEQAISSLKASYFWNNRLIDSHILLGRIYIQKRDCLQAKNYSVSALTIDSENEDALALERQVERCSK